MNKTETLIKEIQISVDENEALESMSQNVWNFTSIAHVVQLIQHLKDQEEFYTGYLKTLVKDKNNLDDQLLQLQSEYDEMQEERDNIQREYNTLKLDHIRCVDDLEEKIAFKNRQTTRIQALRQEVSDLENANNKLQEQIDEC